MRWRFWRRRYAPPNLNGVTTVNGEAVKARLEAERNLREARKDWPRVQEAHDRLAEWIESALRGQT